MEEIKKIIKDKDNLIFKLQEENKKLKEEKRKLKYNYDEALLNCVRIGNQSKRWETKYKTAIEEYTNIIKKQAELGIELEARIKELEGKYENTTNKTI